VIRKYESFAILKLYPPPNEMLGHIEGLNPLDELSLAGPKVIKSPMKP